MQYCFVVVNDHACMDDHLGKTFEAHDDSDSHEQDEGVHKDEEDSIHGDMLEEVGDDDVCAADSNMDSPGAC